MIKENAKSLSGRGVEDYDKTQNLYFYMYSQL